MKQKALDDLRKEYSDKVVNKMKARSLQKIDTSDITKPIIGEHVLIATPIDTIDSINKNITMYHVKSRVIEYDKLTPSWEEYFEAHIVDKKTNHVQYIKIK